MGSVLIFWVCGFLNMYLCTVSAYSIVQVWVGNCMCVFPVISPLFIIQNVLTLITITAGIESDTVTVTECVKSQGFKKRHGCFYPCSIRCGETSEVCTDLLPLDKLTLSWKVEQQWLTLFCSLPLEQSLKKHSRDIIIWDVSTCDFSISNTTIFSSNDHVALCLEHKIIALYSLKWPKIH